MNKRIHIICWWFKCADINSL